MICDQCEAEAEGEQSIVKFTAGESTCMGWFRFHDADGRIHSHDPNTHTTLFTCSRGHVWSKSHKKMCLTCGMWWLRSEESSQENVITNDTAKT